MDPDKTKCNYYYEGAYVVPYHNVAVSTMPRHWITDFVNVDKVRIKSLGFKVKNITVLQEQIVTRAASTSLENTFQGKPHLQMFIDGHHSYDRNVGHTPAGGGPVGMASAEHAHCMWAMGGKKVNGVTAANTPWNVNPSQPTFIEPSIISVNNYFLEPYPQTQAQGELPHVGLYMLESYPGQTTTFPWATMKPNDKYAVLNRHMFVDVFDTKIVSEGDQPGFVWVNPEADWRTICREDYSYPDKDQQVARNSTTSFPPTRDSAMSWPYRRFWSNETTEKGRNNYTKDHDAEFDYYNRTIGNTHSSSDIWSDNVPPNVFLKVEPLLGPTGPINITAQVYIEYTMELEFHEARYGMMTDLHLVTPAAQGVGRPNNQYGVRGTNTIMDPQTHTIGQNSFWSGDMTEHPVNITAKRRRPEDEVVASQLCVKQTKDGRQQAVEKRVEEPRSDQSD